MINLVNSVSAEKHFTEQPETIKSIEEDYGNALVFLKSLKHHQNFIQL